MSAWVRWLLNPFQSSPRRWFWVAALVLTLLVLWLTDKVR